MDSWIVSIRGEILTESELRNLVWTKLFALGYVVNELDCYITTKCPLGIKTCLDTSGGFIFDSVEIRVGHLDTLVSLLGQELNEYSI